MQISWFSMKLKKNAIHYFVILETVGYTLLHLMNYNHTYMYNILQTVGCIGALWIISPKLTGIMCIVIPVIIGIGTFMGNGLRSLSKAAQAQVLISHNYSF